MTVCWVVMLRGAANSFQRLGASRSLNPPAGPHLSARRAVRLVMVGLCSADRGSVACATGGSAGDGWLYQPTGREARAGFSAGLRFRHSLVRSLLFLNHHPDARPRRAERPRGSAGSVSLLSLFRALSRAVRFAIE